MKFIVSAKSLWILMEKTKAYYVPEKGENYEMVVEKNKLHFNGVSELYVESKEDAKIELSKKQFKRLRKVVRALEDQPIVLYTDGSRQLQIHNICF